MDKNNVKIGQIVYYEEHQTGNIDKATITEIINDTAVKIASENYGTRDYPINELYTSLDEIKKVIKEKWDKDVKMYKESIKTVEDLINFPLTHCFCGEEYTEYEAIAAYKERAKEFGFEICE